MQGCKNFSIENQKGKIFVVTGGNSGLGLYTVYDLARAGGTVVIASRSMEKAYGAQNSLLKLLPNATIDVMELDLSSFASIKSFSENVKAKYGSIDVLINNAGVMALPKREVTKDGLEMQVGTNHFGHFLLTSLLFPILRKNGRIVNHASTAVVYANRESILNDFQSVKSYGPWVAYGNSKAANLLFTYELNSRLINNSAKNPNNIFSVAVHPGWSATNLQSSASGWEGKFLSFGNNIIAMTAHEGSQSQTLAAVGPNVKPSYQNYIGPKYFILGEPQETPTLEYTWDKDLMKFLWSESLRITGTNFLA